MEIFLLLLTTRNVIPLSEEDLLKGRKNNRYYL